MFLTRAGATLVERLHAQVVESLTELTDRLDPSDQQRLHQLLRRMLDAQDA